jgi:hypothetical protein
LHLKAIVVQDAPSRLANGKRLLRLFHFRQMEIATKN